MAIPHVTAGEVARAAEQNALIDEVNEHTSTLDLNAGTLGDHTARLDAHTTRLDELEHTQPLCVLRKSADQIIRNQASTGAGDPSLTDQIVTWQVAEVDPLGMKSGDTIVIPETRPYMIAGQLNLAPLPDGSTGPGECILYITCNDGFVGDTSVAATGQPGKIGGGFGNGLSTVSVRMLNAGDVLRVWCYQSSSQDRAARANAFGGCTLAVSTPQ